MRRKGCTRPASGGRTSRALLGVGLVALSSGCALSAEDAAAIDAASSPGAESDDGAFTEALVQVQLRESFSSDGQGEVLASIARMGRSDGAEELLARAGLRPEVRENGKCTLALSGEVTPDAKHEGPERRPSDAAARVELAFAESFRLVTTRGEDVLVPHAFPAVVDGLGGVVYSSRDRAGSNLVSGGDYRILVDGILEEEGAEPGAIDTSHRAPELPSGVTFNGEPWLGDARLPSRGRVEVAWLPAGGDHDALSISLGTERATYSCTFADSRGSGTFTMPEFGAAETARAPFGSGERGSLSVHRLRTEAGAGSSPDLLVEVRFDFAITSNLEFE